MQWYWIVLITIFAVHTVNVLFILWGQAKKKDDDLILILVSWAVYFPLTVLLYPVRAHKRYELHRGYYEKNGVSKLACFFGKRVKR